MRNFQNLIKFRSDITSSEHFRLVPSFYCDKRDLGCKRTYYMENTWVMVKVRHKKGCGTTSVGTILSYISGKSYLALNGVKKPCMNVMMFAGSVTKLRGWTRAVFQHWRRLCCVTRMSSIQTTTTASECYICSASCMERRRDSSLTN